LLYHKTFYKESDVDAFMKSHFGKDEAIAEIEANDDDDSGPDDTGRDPEEAEDE